MALEDILGSGLSRSQKFSKFFWSGTKAGVSVGGLGAVMIGFQAAKSPRGSILPSLVGQSVAFGASIPLAGFASAAISLIPGIGPVAAVLIGAIVADYGEYRFGSSLIKRFRQFSDINKKIRHLEMGGSYVDSESAQRQRFLAIQDMNAAMIPGRRYLGNEALLMHR